MREICRCNSPPLLDQNTDSIPTVPVHRMHTVPVEKARSVAAVLAWCVSGATTQCTTPPPAFVFIEIQFQEGKKDRFTSLSRLLFLH